METSNCYYIYIYSNNSDQVDNSIIQKKKKKPQSFMLLFRM